VVVVADRVQTTIMATLLQLGSLSTQMTLVVVPTTTMKTSSRGSSEITVLRVTMLVVQL